MISNIPQPNTYRKEYLEAASRVRVIQAQDGTSETYKPVDKNIAQEVSQHIKVEPPAINIPSTQSQPKPNKGKPS